jgi:hypothetical protein
MVKFWMEDLKRGLHNHFSWYQLQIIRSYANPKINMLSQSSFNTLEIQATTDF